MKNILLITTDQQHYLTLGVNNPQIKTPNLDELISIGTQFTRAYCPNPTCTPSRASIITGLYPSRHQAWTLGTKLDENTITIGHVCMNNGIKTSLIGKAHFQQLLNDQEMKYKSLESYPILQDLDFWERYKGCYYGFEKIKLLRNHTNSSHVGQHYAIWLNEKVDDNWKKYFLKDTGEVDIDEYMSDGISPRGQYPQGREWEIPLDLHYNRFITDETIKTIDEAIAEDKSFFTWASYPDPHPDYLVPEPYASMYNPKDIEIPQSYYDQEIEPSELVLKTRELDPNFTEYDETKTWLHGCRSHIQDEKSLKADIAIYYGMITYIDDQVGKLMNKLKEAGIYDQTLIIFTTDHGHYLGQHNLVRKGPFMYEDGIRIPFIVSSGGYTYKQSTCDELVSLIDIYPTIAEHLEIDYNEYDVQGRSLLPLIIGEEKRVREGVLCEFRHEPFKLNLRTYISKKYKLTILRGNYMGEIYDLENDPDEMINLWSDEKLRNKLLLDMLFLMLDEEPLHMPRVCGA